MKSTISLTRHHYELWALVRLMAINVADMAFVLPVAQRHWGARAGLMMTIAAGLCAFGVAVWVEGMIVRVEGMSPPAYRRYVRDHRSAEERRRVRFGTVFCVLMLVASLLLIARMPE